MRLQLDNKQVEIHKTKELVKTIRMEKEKATSDLEKIPKCVICLDKQVGKVLAFVCASYFAEELFIFYKSDFIKAGSIAHLKSSLALE